MADHSFITFYAHIGRRIRIITARTLAWVAKWLFNLFALVFGIVYIGGQFLPVFNVAQLCAT